MASRMLTKLVALLWSCFYLLLPVLLLPLAILASIYELVFACLARLPSRATTIAHLDAAWFLFLSPLVVLVVVAIPAILFGPDSLFSDNPESPLSRHWLPFVVMSFLANPDVLADLYAAALGRARERRRQCGVSLCFLI